MKLNKFFINHYQRIEEVNEMKRRRNKEKMYKSLEFKDKDINKYLNTSIEFKPKSILNCKVKTRNCYSRANSSSIDAFNTKSNINDSIIETSIIDQLEIMNARSHSQVEDYNKRFENDIKTRRSKFGESITRLTNFYSSLSNSVKNSYRYKSKHK